MIPVDLFWGSPTAPSSQVRWRSRSVVPASQIEKDEGHASVIPGEKFWNVNTTPTVLHPWQHISINGVLKHWYILIPRIFDLDKHNFPGEYVQNVCFKAHFSGKKSESGANTLIWTHLPKKWHKSGINISNNKKLFVLFRRCRRRFENWVTQSLRSWSSPCLWGRERVPGLWKKNATANRSGMGSSKRQARHKIEITYHINIYVIYQQYLFGFSVFFLLQKWLSPNGKYPHRFSKSKTADQWRCKSPGQFNSNKKCSLSVPLPGYSWEISMGLNCLKNKGHPIPANNHDRSSHKWKAPSPYLKYRQVMSSAGLCLNP